MLYVEFEVLAPALALRPRTLTQYDLCVEHVLRHKIIVRLRVLMGIAGQI